MGNFVKYYFPALAWTVLIFVLSSIPNLKGPDLGFSWQDKLEHFLFYGVYGVTLIRAFYFQGRFTQLQKQALLFAIFFGILYAISDEIHQYFVPGRKMDVLDVLADSLGVAAGAWLYARLFLNKNKAILFK